MKLNNNIILITGAAGFLGSKIIKTLLEEKAYCILIDKNKTKLKKLSIELNKKNYKNFSIFNVDITSERQIKKIHKIINKRYKRIDGILNLAAIDALVEPIINGFWFFLLFEIFNQYKAKVYAGASKSSKNPSPSSISLSKLAPINNKKNLD